MYDHTTDAKKEVEGWARAHRKMEALAKAAKTAAGALRNCLGLARALPRHLHSSSKKGRDNSGQPDVATHLDFDIYFTKNRFNKK